MKRIMLEKDDQVNWRFGHKVCSDSEAMFDLLMGLQLMNCEHSELTLRMCDKSEAISPICFFHPKIFEQ